MEENTNHSTHGDEFTGKYESKNPLAKWLVRGFYKSVKHVIPTDVVDVLEVGCGAGYSTAWIQSMFPSNVRYSASDISEELVNLARQQVPTVTFTIESVYGLPHKNNSKDLVICLETLEHLESPEKALIEILRVTSKYALVSVPREPLWRVLNVLRGSYLADFGNTPGHINHWSNGGFKTFIAQYAHILKSATPVPWSILLLKKK